MSAIFYKAIATYSSQEQYGSTVRLASNLSIVLNAKLDLPKEALAHCISLALTHHSRKKSAKSKVQSK